MNGYIAKNLRKIIVNAFIVWFLTAFGGFVVGFFLSASGVMDVNIRTLLLAISNVMMLVFGFFIVSMRNDDNYWLHLSSVAFLAWLSGFVNLLIGANFISILLGIFLVFGCMFIGGGLGLLIRRRKRT